jgi:hypothetical protein
MRKPVVIALAFGAALFAGLSGSYVVPLDHAAIQYATEPVTDPAAKLNAKLARGEVKLQFSEEFGYLPALLDALAIPQQSQVLVFSKTSFQAPRIAPRTPRALYFSDTASVGYVQGGDVLEVAALDPRQGVVFYTLDQIETGKLRLERRDTSCLQCHATGGTLGVPGLVVRSVYPEPSGMPLFHAGGFITDHRSPLKERWGGWYVTGTHGSQTHMGNAVARNRDKPDQLETTGTQNLTDLIRRFDTGAYLTPHSDIVALMTLEHQTHMTNLITRVGFETRMALHMQQALNRELGEPADYLSDSTRNRIHAAADELVEYLLFSEEAQLTEPLRGTSGFAEVFAKQGPRDAQGRSLRDFDLRTRLFRYPCSYLIYSEAFDHLPAAARDRVYDRLHAVLSGRDTTAKFARLSSDDRKAILEILRDTKPGLPESWRR